MAIRDRLGISQEELARRVGVSFASVNAWENGRSSPRSRHRERLEEMATELGMRLSWDAVVVERDPRAGALTAELLRSIDPGVLVHVVRTSTEALVVCGAVRPRLLLLDVDGPGPGPTEVAEALRGTRGMGGTVLVGVGADPAAVDGGGLRRVLRQPVHRSALEELLATLDDG